MESSLSSAGQTSKRPTRGEIKIRGSRGQPGRPHLQRKGAQESEGAKLEEESRANCQSSARRAPAWPAQRWERAPSRDAAATGTGAASARSLGPDPHRELKSEGRPASPQYWTPNTAKPHLQNAERILLSRIRYPAKLKVE